MNALTFDTHAAIKNLIQSGVTEKQAEAITDTVKQAQDAHLEQLATKADLKDVTIRIDRAVMTLGSLMIGLTGVILAFLQWKG